MVSGGGIDTNITRALDLAEKGIINEARTRPLKQCVMGCSDIEAAS